jgi:hypothetical protein
MFGQPTGPKDMVLGKLLLIIPRKMIPCELQFQFYFPTARQLKKHFGEEYKQKHQDLVRLFETMYLEAGIASEAMKNQGFWSSPSDSMAKKYHTNFGGIFVRARACLPPIHSLFTCRPLLTLRCDVMVRTLPLHAASTTRSWSWPKRCSQHFYSDFLVRTFAPASRHNIRVGR